MLKVRRKADMRHKLRHLADQDDDDLRRHNLNLRSDYRIFMTLAVNCANKNTWTKSKLFLRVDGLPVL